MLVAGSAKWIELVEELFSKVVLLWRMRWRLVEDKQESEWCWWIRR